MRYVLVTSLIAELVYFVLIIIISSTIGNRSIFLYITGIRDLNDFILLQPRIVNVVFHTVNALVVVIYLITFLRSSNYFVKKRFEEFYQFHRIVHIDNDYDDWKSEFDQIKNFISQYNIDYWGDQIKSTANPLQLNEAKKRFKSLHDQELDYQNAIVDLKKNLNPIVDIISGISIEIDKLQEIEMMWEKLNTYETELEHSGDSILELFDKRDEYFKPWDSILELIRQTQEGVPVNISRIAELTNSGDDHAEQLIKQLLKENPKIGQYHELEQVYIKGSQITDEIDKLLNDFQTMERSQVGKM